MKPEIILPYNPGTQNADISKAQARLSASQSYKDLSTVIVTPTRGGRSLTPKFVSCMMGLIKPMNQKVYGNVFLSGMEVGEAFNAGVEMILGHPELAKFKFLLCWEDDNLPPPDGLLKLYEGIKDYDAVGGLYWTKGEAGQPMCYGRPDVAPLNFIPQIPMPEAMTRCNGLGMGFTLFRMSVFKKLDKPYFRTVQDWDPQKGARGYTQDLHCFERMAQLGMKVACDSRIKVGHYDEIQDRVW